MIKFPEELKDAYQVKAKSAMDHQVLFGVLERHGEDAERELEKGNVIVEDAITGARWMLSLETWWFEPQENNIRAERDPETHLPLENDYDRYVNEKFKEAIAAHRAAGPGVQKGKLCVAHAADGICAYYEITRVYKKVCKVEWRGYDPDRHVDMRWGYVSNVPIVQAKATLCRWLEKA